MTIENTDVKITGVYAKNATKISTTGGNLNQGTAYRNDTLTQSQAENALGSAYQTIASSAIYNQLNYEVTTLVDIITNYGILSFNNSITYGKGSLVLATNNKLYYSLVEGNIGNDPAIDISGTNWQLVLTNKWDAGTNYILPTNVWGSDNTIYEAKQNTGPGTPNGAKDPVTDSGRVYWTKIPTATDIINNSSTSITCFDCSTGYKPNTTTLNLWSNTADYYIDNPKSINRVVTNSTGVTNYWDAIASSGPAISNVGAIDPETDTARAYWKLKSPTVWTVIYNYKAGDKVLASNNITYIAIVDNVGDDPVNDSGAWETSTYEIILYNYSVISNISVITEYKTGMILEFILNSPTIFGNIELSLNNLSLKSLQSIIINSGVQNQIGVPDGTLISGANDVKISYTGENFIINDSGKVLLDSKKEQLFSTTIRVVIVNGNITVFESSCSKIIATRDGAGIYDLDFSQMNPQKIKVDNLSFSYSVADSIIVDNFGILAIDREHFGLNSTEKIRILVQETGTNNPNGIDRSVCFTANRVEYVQDSPTVEQYYETLKNLENEGKIESESVTSYLEAYKTLLYGSVNSEINKKKKL